MFWRMPFLHLCSDGQMRAAFPKKLSGVVWDCLYSFCVFWSLKPILQVLIDWAASVACGMVFSTVSAFFVFASSLLAKHSSKLWKPHKLCQGFLRKNMSPLRWRTRLQDASSNAWCHRWSNRALSLHPTSSVRIWCDVMLEVDW